jgi:anthranilate synthase component II
LILLVDNYDSFTYNLLDYVLSLGAECKVLRNDLPFETFLAYDWDGIILSPGPGKPSEANSLMQILDYFHDKKPILGICLGHQAIGEYFGAELEKAPKPMHGKISEVILSNEPVFEEIPEKINVTRYHSLIVSRLKDNMKCIAKTTEDNLVMGIKHEKLPVLGIQFHPEAHLTEFGKQMISNWLKMCQRKK